MSDHTLKFPDRRINGITPELAEIVSELTGHILNTREAEKVGSPNIKIYRLRLYDTCRKLQATANEWLHRDDEALPMADAELEEFRLWSVALVLRIIAICTDERDNARTSYSLEHQRLQTAADLLVKLSPILWTQSSEKK